MLDAAWGPAALLPAALLLLLGGAVLFALRRWYDPVPWRVAAVFALLLFGLLGPVLFGGKVLLPLGNLVGYVPYRGLPPPEPPTHAIQGDLVHEMTPWQAQVRRALADGRWPLWNEQAGAGMPLMADPQSQAFQPLLVAALPLPLSAAIGLTGALRVLLALVGMFVLLRRQGIGEAAALCGSVGYGLSGAVLIWLGWPVANAVAWMPLGLYAVVRCHRDGGRRDAALLAAVTVALLLGGHPETVLQSGGLMGLFVLACAWERRRAGAPIVPFLVRCCGAVAVAGLLVAPALLLQQAYLPATERAVALPFFLAVPTWEQLWSAWQQPQTWREWGARVEPQLLSLFALRAWGDHELFWGAFNFVAQGAASVGAAIGVLALAAAAARRRSRLPQESLLLGFAAVALLLIAAPPELHRFLGQLPLFGPSSVHHNHRLMLLVALAAAYLAACEVERWRRGERSPRGLAVGALGTVGVLARAYLGHPVPSAVAAGEQRGWLCLQLGAVALIVALLVVLGRSARAEARVSGVQGAEARGSQLGGGEARGSRLRDAVPWLIAAVVAGELVALHGNALTPAPSRLFYPRTPALQFVARHIGDSRLAGLADVFPANFAQAYGFADARIEGPARPAPYVELVDSLRDPGPRTLANAAQLGQPGARLYDLLGVRYLLAPPGHELPLPVAYRDSTMWIYEHPRPLPRFFLPPTATVYRGGGWAAWFRRPRDFAARALVAAGPPGSPAPRWRARRGGGRAAFAATRHEPGRWSAEMRASEPRVLVGSVYHDGGWRLLVDGRPQSTMRANGPLFGAWLPAGEHDLDLLYRPPRFVAGCLLTALALAAGIAWLMPPPASGAERRLTDAL